MNNKTELKSKSNFFYRMLCGFFLGISVIAPGVSGSIMAVMMGIYDELINIISNPFKNFKKNFIYLMPMGMGAVLSILILIQLLSFMFENYPVPSYLLFIGLIGGSLPMVFKEANTDGFKRRYIIAVTAAFAFALTIGMFARFNVTVAADTTGLFYYPACGAVAGVTSMIPGMSVSMVLMMLNAYEPLLEAAKTFDFITVIPVTVCFVVGMVLFSRFTKFIFRRYHNFAYFMVLGFMCGSIISIFPGLPSGAVNWILSFAAIFAGVFISNIFQKLGKSFKANKSENDI
ncbi:MAG: DUF368 domain-containing protein [Eubacteriales bacterium]